MRDITLGLESQMHYIDQANTNVVGEKERIAPQKKMLDKWMYFDMSFVKLNMYHVSYKF